MNSHMQTISITEEGHEAQLAHNHTAIFDFAYSAHAKKQHFSIRGFACFVPCSLSPAHILGCQLTTFFPLVCAATALCHTDAYTLDGLDPEGKCVSSIVFLCSAVGLHVTEGRCLISYVFLNSSGLETEQR